MNILNQSIGVDVSKSDLVAYFECMLSDQRIKKLGQRKFTNTAKGIKEFTEWVSKKSLDQGVLQIIMEATGRYHEALTYHLYEHHYRVCVVLPNRIKHFARSMNQFSKTDPIDAALIARYGSYQLPEPWHPSSPSMRHLRELTRERQDVIKMRTQTINRLSALRVAAKPPASTIERLELQLVFFNQQIQDIEAEMERLGQQDQVLSQQVDRLTSIPYVGKITAYTILAETAGFVLFENRNQLIKYAGLDVVKRQSGSSINGKTSISKRGNAHLRAALYMPAVGMINRPSVFQDVYLRCLERHNNKSKALMAVQRKLLLVAFGLHQNGQSYDPQVHRQRTPKQVGEHSGSPTVARLVS